MSTHLAGIQPRPQSARKAASGCVFVFVFVVVFMVMVMVSGQRWAFGWICLSYMYLFIN